MDGEAKLMKFQEERFFTEVKSIFDSVPRNKHFTFANERKENSTSGKDKVTAGIMERLELPITGNKKLRKNPYWFLMQMVPFKKYKKISSSKN